MAGVYAWIRDNVRRAVLLGFSDAVEQLGIPNEKDQVNPRLQAIFCETPNAPALTRSSGSSRNSRKRLGRSLDDLSRKPDQAAS